MIFTNTIKKTIVTAIFGLAMLVAYGLWLGSVTAAPSVILTANGAATASYPDGGTVDLAWNIVDTDNCSISGTDGFSYTVDTSSSSPEFPFGLTTVSPGADSVTYTLSCQTGAPASVTVYIAPTVNLSVPPGSPTIAAGETINTTITLTTQNAVSCAELTASVPVYYGGSVVPGTDYTLGTSGSVDVSGITDDVTFSITCTGQGGYTALDSVLYDVTVDASGAAGTISMNANPSTVNGIEWVNLSYTTARIVSCQRGETPSRAGNESWASASAPRSTTNYPLVVDSDTTFWVQCVDLNGATISDSVTVTVDISTNPNYCWDTRYAPATLTEVSGGITKAADESCVMPSFTASCPWASNPSAGIYVYDIDGGLRSRYNHATPVDDGHYYPRADFDGVVRDDSTSSQSTDYAIQMSLPNGSYDVSIYTWDASSKRDTQSQNHEEVEVVVYNSAHTQVFKSNATPDLPDNISQASWFGVVNNSATINNAVWLRTKISDAAIAETDSSPWEENSAVAGCVKFDLTSAAAMGIPGAPACPFTSSSTRTVITFPASESRLRADRPNDYHTGWEWYVPAETGAHTIRAAVWDGYVNRVDSVQTNESINVEITDPGGATVLVTNNTPDLPDGVDDSGLQITELIPTANLVSGGPSSGYWVRANHASAGVGTNSLDVICLAIDGPTHAQNLTVDLQTAPSGLSAPGNIMLTWSSTDAESCSLTSSPNVISRNTLSGSESVLLPTGSTTYAFTFECQQGVNTQTVTKTVTVGGAPNLTAPTVLYDASSVTDPLTSDYSYVKAEFSTTNSGVGDITVNTAARVRFDEGNDGSFEGNNIVTVAPIAGGATSPVYSHTFYNVPFGHNRIVVNVDHTDKVVESNETDNINDIVFTLLPVADISVDVDRKFIEIGDTVNIMWDTTAIFPMNCNVSAPGINYSFDPSIVGPASTTISGPIRGEADVRLHCVEPITGETFVDSVTVNIGAVIIER